MNDTRNTMGHLELSGITIRDADVYPVPGYVLRRILGRVIGLAESISERTAELNYAAETWEEEEALIPLTSLSRELLNELDRFELGLGHALRREGR